MIRRTELHFDRDYTIMPNMWARDVRLSRKARGLLAELLSHSIGWKVSLEYLVASGTEGRDAVRSAISELEDLGYLTRSRVRDAAGRLGGAHYALADPHHAGSPTSDIPTQGNRPRKKTSTKKKSTKYVPPSGIGGKLASERQVAYLLDMYRTLGTLTPDDDARIRALSYGEADAEIKRHEFDFTAAKATQRRVAKKPTKPKPTPEEVRAEWCRQHGLTVDEYLDIKVNDPDRLDLIKRRGKVA